MWFSKSSHDRGLIGRCTHRINGDRRHFVVCCSKLPYEKQRFTDPGQRATTGACLPVYQTLRLFVVSLREPAISPTILEINAAFNSRPMTPVSRAEVVTYVHTVIDSTPVDTLHCRLAVSYPGYNLNKGMKLERLSPEDATITSDATTGCDL